MIRKSVSLLCLAALLAACNLPDNPAVALAASGTGAWIDAPLDGSTLPLGPVEVVSHAASLSGVTQVILSVDGADVASGAPESTSATLVTLHQTWQPGGPGNYALQVRAQTPSGGLATSAVSYVTISDSGAPPGLFPTPFMQALARITSTPAPAETPSPSPTPTGAAPCTNRARMLLDVTVPDNSVFEPGTAFVKTWRLLNDGTCAWTLGGTGSPGYSLIFQSGQRMGGVSPTALPSLVAPGEIVDVSVQLTAPASEGTFRGNWMLESSAGEAFGIGSDADTPFWVQIVVRRTPPPDTEAPRVAVSHDPPGSPLPVGSPIAFLASASDNVGVVRIEIWVMPPGESNQLVQTCTGSTTCSYRGVYGTEGVLSYIVLAYDAAGNEGSNGDEITLMVMRSQLGLRAGARMAPRSAQVGGGPSR